MTLTEAREALATATATHDEIRTAHRVALAGHDAAIRALGAEPRVDTERGPAVPPSRAEPSAAELAAAEALVASQDAIGRAHRAHVEELNRARTDAAFRADAKAAAAEAARRGQAQLDAARTAGEGIGADALGDLGPVRLVIPHRPATASAVDPYVLLDTGDGPRPWGEHSTGEQRLAAYRVAGGLRRLLGQREPLARAIPLGVDEAGSWSGVWPEDGLALFLVTSDEEQRVAMGAP